MLQNSNVNILNAVTDFLKVEYVNGLTNEFNTMDSLVNSLKKETVMGEYIQKTFALGVSDNVRTMGMGNDTYELGLGDFGTGAETVTAQFDAMAKLIGVFSVTDETIVKGTTSGSIVDVVSDNLNRMKLNLKNNYQRMIYGSNSGLIGVVTGSGADGVIATGDVDTSSISGQTILTVRISNSYSILPGTGLLLYVDGNNYAECKVWQKDNSVMHDEVIKLFVQSQTGTLVGAAPQVFNKQLKYAGGAISSEYTGLQDIIIDNADVFGVDRSLYSSLKTTVQDLEDAPLGEIVLRDLSDHIALTANDDAKISIVASQARIISAIEKDLYQYKRYSMDSATPTANLGIPKIQFDQWTLHKDKFSRDANVYLLDMNKIGELLRKDFSWLTSGGPQGILERRTGTEIYEGIMTKYGDMMVDSFRAHAAFINASDTPAVV